MNTEPRVLVKEDGIYGFRCPVEPEGSDYAENCPDGDRFDKHSYNEAYGKYVKAVEQAKASAIRFEDQAVYILIKNLHLFGIGVKPGIYSIPNLDWEEVEVDTVEDGGGGSYVAGSKTVLRLKSTESKPLDENGYLLLPSNSTAYNLKLCRAISYLSEDENSIAKEIIEDLKSLITK